MNQYNSAEQLNIHATAPNGNGASTAFAHALVRERYNAAVGGMFGCTSVIVASDAGVWVSHFWELYSFRLTAGLPPPARTQADKDRFTQDVLNQLRDGGTNVPGLQQFTGQRREFGEAQKPMWAIFTPSDSHGGSNGYRYEEEVGEIKGVLNNLFPNAPDNIIPYDARADDESQLNTPSAKLVFQFDPIQQVGTDPNNRCDVYQVAMLRVWMEDRPQPAWERSWIANDNQLITDFGIPAPRRAKGKRNDGAACQLPPIIEAPYASNLPDMKPQDVPDPPAGTPYITLNPSGATSNSGVSNTVQSSTVPSTLETSILSESASGIASPLRLHQSHLGLH